MTTIIELVGSLVAILGAAVLFTNAVEMLGAPFLLATLAMFIVGITALGFRRRRENGMELVIEKRTTRRDVVYFLVAFAVAAGAGIVALPTYVKVLVAIVLVAAYAFYVWRTIVKGGEALEETPDNLTIWPESSWGRAPTWAVVIQLLATLVVMGAGAHFFVEGVESASEAMGIPAGLIALVLAPLATELPEKFNSII